MWISFGILWMISPIIELCIILGLLVERSRNKRLIQELREGKETELMLVGRNARVMGYGYWPKERKPEKAEETAEHVQTQEPEAIPSGEAFEHLNEGISDSSAETGRKKKVKENIWNRNTMGTMALILGIVFVVLAGVIFATTTWKVMPDSFKVLLVFGCSVLFFGTSRFVEHFFGIRKTGNAFYVLGSIFLFLSILAAAYFQLLGSTFVLMGRNRWKVLWVGSLVLEISFLAGIKRFNERLYTQASLWGLSISMLFMMKAFGVGWRSFISLMTLYAFALVLAGAWAKQEKREKKDETGWFGFWGLLSGEVPVFACLHFWFFSVCTMLDGLFVLTLGSSASLLGMASLAGVILGMKRLARDSGKNIHLGFYAVSASEICLYIVKLWENGKVPGAGILLICLCVMALWDIWRKDVLSLSILFLGGSTQLYLYLEEGTGVWWVVYSVFLAVYLLRYWRSETKRKPALSASAALIAIAFWEQSILIWPDWIELECFLLPIVFSLWAMGEIWGKSEGIRIVQRVSYMFCLVILAWDAWSGGLVVDALIVEGCCLAAFILGQVKKDVWWVRFSGGLMLILALLMTKDFWMNISWWIYLLAAGMGLIFFAAVSEKKRQAGKKRAGQEEK